MIPLQITWRGMRRSEALSALVEKKVRGLERFYDHVGSCRVLIEQPHHHRRTGEHFHVRVVLSVPGSELVVEREPSQRERNEDAYTAVLDAFHAARRELQDYIRQRRGFVKTHERGARHIPVAIGSATGSGGGVP